MKNKLVTYLLLAGVISIWAFVLYQVFGAVSENNTPISTLSGSTKKMPVDLAYYTEQAAAPLDLHYRSPIAADGSNLITVVEDDDNAMALASDYNSYTASPMYEAPPADPELRYLGFIENEQKKKRIAIVDIQGVSYMLAKNEKESGFKILDIGNDFIKVLYNGSTKTIYK